MPRRSPDDRCPTSTVLLGALLAVLVPGACSLPRSESVGASPPPDRAGLVAAAAAELSRGPSPLGEEILGGSGEEAVPWLMGLARSADPHVRERAKSLLLAVGGAEPFGVEERVTVILRNLARPEPCATQSLLELVRLREDGTAALPYLRTAAAGSGAEADVARRLLFRLGQIP